MKLFKTILADTKGLAAVEFALLLGFVAVAILGAVAGLGASVQASYQDTAQKVANATP